MGPSAEKLLAHRSEGVTATGMFIPCLPEFRRIRLLETETQVALSGITWAVVTGYLI